VTVAATTPLRSAIETMNDRGFRRLPVVNPGNGKLEGVVTARDILDFFGGSGRDLVERKLGGNLMSAFNYPVSSIMRTDVTSVGFNVHIREAIRRMSDKKLGGLPVIDSDRKMVGILTERDILFKLSYRLPDKTIGEVMTVGPITISSGANVGLAIEKMLRYGFRRLPVLEGDRVIGMVTMRSILRYFGDAKDWSLHDVLSLPVTQLSFSEFGGTSPGTRLTEAVDLMRVRNIGALIVTGPHFDLLGIITERDVFDIIAKTYLSAV
jgi:CBS domain-containing protein